MTTQRWSGRTQRYSVQWECNCGGCGSFHVEPDYDFQTALDYKRMILQHAKDNRARAKVKILPQAD